MTSVFPLKKSSSLYVGEESVILAGILAGKIKTSPVQFTDFVWRKTYQAIQEISSVGHPTLKILCKMVELSEERRSLLEKPPSSEELNTCIRLLKKAEALRDIRKKAIKVASEEINLDQAIKSLQDAIRRYEDVGRQGTVISAETMLANYKDSKEPDWGILYGFEELDAWTKGMHPGEYIVIAGRPSMGKSSLARQIAVQASDRWRVAYFSLEDYGRRLYQRFLSLYSGMPADDLSEKGIPEDVQERIKKSGLFIGDTPVQKPGDIESVCRILKENGGLDLLILDYIQLLYPDRTVNNPIQEITEISRAIKHMARDMEIPIIAISQLSRESERRESRKPILSDLRGSGSLEQDADVVIFIHREKGRKDAAQFMLAKNKNGPTGEFDVKFDSRITVFLPFEEPPF